MCFHRSVPYILVGHLYLFHLGMSSVSGTDIQAENSTTLSGSICPTFSSEGPGPGTNLSPSQTVVHAKCRCEGIQTGGTRLACPVWTVLHGAEVVTNRSTDVRPEKESCDSLLQFTITPLVTVPLATITVQCSVPGLLEYSDKYTFRIEGKAIDYLDDDGNVDDENMEKEQTSSTSPVTHKTEGPSSNFAKTVSIYLMLGVAALLLLASAVGVFLKRHKMYKRRALRRRSARRYKITAEEQLERKDVNGCGPLLQQATAEIS